MVTPAYPAAGMTGPPPCRISGCGSPAPPASASTPAVSTKDIITGTVFQRPGLNDLLNVVQAGDVLMVTALDRLGRDTLSLLELKVLDMLVDAQDVAGGGQLVALVAAGVAAIERANISRRTKQGLERARAEGKLAGRGCAPYNG